MMSEQLVLEAFLQVGTTSSSINTAADMGSVIFCPMSVIPPPAKRVLTGFSALGKSMSGMTCNIESPTSPLLTTSTPPSNGPPAPNNLSESLKALSSIGGDHDSPLLMTSTPLPVPNSLSVPLRALSETECEYVSPLLMISTPPPAPNSLSVPLRALSETECEYVSPL